MIQYANVKSLCRKNILGNWALNMLGKSFLLGHGSLVRPGTPTLAFRSSHSRLFRGFDDVQFVLVRRRHV